MNIENIDKKIKAYALKNSTAYGGKANPGAVISALFNEGLEKSEVKEIMPKVQEIIKEIGKLSIEEQKKEFEKLEEIISEREIREGLQELPNAENGIVMRFAPSPSGGLHVGHASTLSLIYAYYKKYEGKLIVRIEDTNPENILPEAYEMIKEDSKWLTEGNCEIFIQSERMEIYYKYAEKLIDGGNAYVCSCSGDNFREIAKDKKECPCRSLNIDENKKRWGEMFNKEGFKVGEAVLRFKTPEEYGGMENPNPAMRDFPLARINEALHPIQKNKYRVWPLMNLSVTTDDIEMKMTHIIRGKDHLDNSKRQEMMYKIFGKKAPWTGFTGKYKFTDLILKASLITQEIKDGKYSGWNDSRLPTIQALSKKYKPSAFLKMAENRGLSEVDKVISKKEYFTLLDMYNKEE